MMNLINGDSLEILKGMDENSIDSIVTDPPYGLGFMGKSWDSVLPPTEIWAECRRVLKPGGYLVAMSASRTYHRLAVQLEDLDMICHPMIGWIYGSGFPKATDLSKQFDKQAGTIKTELDLKLAKRIGKCKGGSSENIHQLNATPKDKIGHRHVPVDDLAKKWNGYKYGLQALKPALEPIAVFQKPWKNKKNKRMTDNIKEHGVGAFNIDACRVKTNDNLNGGTYSKNAKSLTSTQVPTNGIDKDFVQPQGRHPANFLHDGSESVEDLFLEQGGIRKTGDLNNVTGLGDGNKYGKSKPRLCVSRGDTGTASRFFNKLPITELDAPFLYTAKPSKRERGAENNHPTVKPIALMSWLIKLVTPEGGTTLDPFMGSGSTGIAAKQNNFNFIGIEREAEYFEIAKQRINQEITNE